MTRPDGLLEIGKLGRPHGVRGEMYLSLTSDRPERRRAGTRIFAADSWWTIDKIRQSNDRFLVQLEGVDVREEAAKLTNAVVFAEPIHDDEALWVHEVVGSRVISPSGVEFGTCIAVLDNPAHAIIETDAGILIPVPFVVSHENGVVVVDPPDGLLELGDNA